MAYQSLYRRYRPRTFGEVRGQQHLVAALRNAVVEDRVGHAYLLSGPRGTGKTSTARILAKALNCPDLRDGEPCGVCESCLAIDAGTSFDVHELDAASNNGVNEVRDLISKIALGTPGRTKVYILDEVHMLTAGASNALLKTLEEPPDHVVFVLATTDPQKVLPTIKSRTQHYEVHLLAAEELRSLVEDVVADAGLDVDSESIEHVVRAGKGSARDTLSALEQVAAAGGVDSDTEAVDELVEALCDQDTGRALVAVDQAVSTGRSPRVLGELLIGRLRDVFLAAMHADLSRLPDGDRARVTDQAGRIGVGAVTRAIELLGEAFVSINDAPDPRLPLEVALVRLTRPDTDTSLAGLLARVERLERGVGPADGGPASVAPLERPGPRNPGPDAAREGDEGDPPGADGTAATGAAPPARPGRPGVASQARQALADRRGAGGEPGGGPPPRPPRPNPARKGPPSAPPVGSDRPPAPDSTPAPAPTAPKPDSNTTSTESRLPADDTDRPAPDAPSNPSPTTSGSSDVATPTQGELEAVWSDTILPSLVVKAKSRFSAGRWIDSDADAVVYALPNQRALDRCADAKELVTDALSAHFGRPLSLRLTLDAGGGPPPPGRGGRSSGPTESEPARARRSGGGSGSKEPAGAAPDDGPDPDDYESYNPDELADAHDAAATSIERITSVFAGAELVTDE